METFYKNKFWITVRLAMSFIFLWAFFDKVFGLGYATSSAHSWLKGASPTTGFLAHTTGIFSGFFHLLSGNIVVDWLFMGGLLLIGLSLLLGKYLKIAGYAGALMMFLMYLAVLPSANNPLIDEHIIYLVLFLGLASRASEKI